MLKQLHLDNISSIDHGKTAVAFQHELENITRDMMDRPGDDRPRKLVLKIELKPKCDESGSLSDVAVAFDVTATLPNRRSNVYSMTARTVRGNGAMLVFHSDDRNDDFTQPPLPVDYEDRSVG